jgi:hypothetical protein
MLLWPSSGFHKIFFRCRLGFRAAQNLVELAGDVALETADDLFLGLAFGGAASLWGADNRFRLLSWGFFVRLRSGSVLVDQSIHCAAALKSDASRTVGNQRRR